MASPIALVSDDQDPRRQFTADGIQRDFVIEWPIRSTDELRIVFGEATEPEISYNIVAANDDAGFTIAFEFPPPVGTLITVYREGQLAASAKYGQETEYSAASVNADNINIYMRLQEIRAGNRRSVTRALADTATDTLRLPVPEAGQLIAWNAAGTALENVPVPGDDGDDEDIPNNDTAVYPADLELTTAAGSDNGPTINTRLAAMSAAGGGELVGDGNAYPCLTGIAVPSNVTVRRLKVQLGPTATFAIAGRKRALYSGLRLVNAVSAAATTMVWDTAAVGGGVLSSLLHIGSPFSITDGANQESGTVTGFVDGTRTVTVSAGGTGGGLQFAYTVAGATITIEAAARLSANSTLLSDQVSVESVDIALIAVGDWVMPDDDRRTGGATTYQEIAQVVGIETAGAGIVSLSRQLRRVYLTSQRAKLTILDPARNAAVLGCSVECIGTANPTRFDSLFEIRYALDSIMADCIYAGTDTVGRRGNMHRIHKSYGCHIIRPVGRNARFTEEGAGNGSVIAYSTRCSIEEPTFQAVRHGAQMIASTECGCDDPDISDVLLTALDFHGLNSVGCYYNGLRNIAFAARTASASNGVGAIGNATWLDGDHECGFLDGTIGPFQGNSGVYGFRVFPPSTKPVIKGLHAVSVEKFFIHRDIAGAGTLKTVGGGIYDCSVDGCDDRVIDIQGKASGASVNTLEDFTISDFRGANLVRGLLAYDVTGLKIRNSELAFGTPDAVTERYALNLKRITSLRAINVETTRANRGISLEGCANARFLTSHILDLADTEWLRDLTGNDGTEFRGCNAYQAAGTPVVVGGSGSTITYKAVSNIGVETTTAYVFSATDKLLGRVSSGGGAAEEVTFTDAAQTWVAATTALAQHDLLHNIGANIASAATTDLATATGWAVNITGNVTITALGTVQAGTPRLLIFAGAPLLTHNATSLILFGANIQASAGDRALMISLGSGNWICADFVRASGSFAAMSSANVSITGGSITGITDLLISDGGTNASTEVGAWDNLFNKGTNIASASTITLAAATQVFVDVTGTTTITSLGVMASECIRFVRFTGILTLTHGASLILPGAANIITAANDTAIFISLGSDVWFCFDYRRSNGQPIGVVAVASGGTGSITKALARVALTGGPTALSDAATIATDCALNDTFSVTLGGNRTLGAPTNVVAGTWYTWQLKQDGTGSRTLSLHANFVQADGDTFAMKTAIASTTMLIAYAETTTRLLVGSKGYA